MVNIYFCGSIRGGRQLANTYEKIIKLLQQHGKVLTEHLGDDAEIQSKDRILSDREIHDRDLQWIVESDLLVADVSIPSLGVGYEIGRAVELGKPILCLFNTEAKHTLSAMIAGIEGMKVFSYKDVNELDQVLEQFIIQHAAHRTS